MSQQLKVLLDKEFFNWVDDEKVPDAVIRTCFIQAVKSGAEAREIDEAFHYIKAKRKALKLRKDEFNPFDEFYQLLYFSKNEPVKNLSSEFISAQVRASEQQIAEAFTVLRYFRPELAKELLLSWF